MTNNRCRAAMMLGGFTLCAGLLGITLWRAAQVELVHTPDNPVWISSFTYECQTANLTTRAERFAKQCPTIEWPNNGVWQLGSFNLWFLGGYLSGNVILFGCLSMCCCRASMCNQDESCPSAKQLMVTCAAVFPAAVTYIFVILFTLSRNTLMFVDKQICKLDLPTWELRQEAWELQLNCNGLSLQIPTPSMQLWLPRVLTVTDRVQSARHRIAASIWAELMAVQVILIVMAVLYWRSKSHPRPPTVLPESATPTFTTEDSEVTYRALAVN